MFNATEIGQQLLNVSNEEALKIIGQVFMPSILIAWLITVVLTIIIALCILKKGFNNFFIIFILPNIVFLVLILFIFVIPIIPEWTANLMKGWLSG